MLKIGDVVQNKIGKDYGTIEYSTFGFSIHMWNEGMNCFGKTLGMSERDVLHSWRKVDMPKGYVVHEYGGIVKQT